MIELVAGSEYDGSGCRASVADRREFESTAMRSLC